MEPCLRPLPQWRIQYEHARTVEVTMKRDTVILVLKIVAAVATAILSVIGASSMAACAAYHAVESKGRTVIVVVDTTTVDHHGNTSIRIK